MKLHGYWRSSCTYRVRIALALKGIPYETVGVPLLEGAQRAENYVRLNPSAQVPTLEVEHEGELAFIGQSVAILEYLEERVPEPPLLPRNRLARARTRQLVEIINAGTQPLQNLAVMKKLAGLGVDEKAFARETISTGLHAFAALAVQTAGKFSAGDTPSLADCALVPQLYNARRFGFDIEAEWPRLAGVEARCAELPAFHVAHPDRQPDAPAADVNSER